MISDEKREEIRRREVCKKWIKDPLSIWDRVLCFDREDFNKIVMINNVINKEVFGLSRITKEQHNENVMKFWEILIEMKKLYSKKNWDYGNSFDESLDEDGLLVAKIRLGDKLNRFSQLIRNEAEVEDESIRDTLIDLANYAAMTVKWMDERESKNNTTIYADGQPVDIIKKSICEPLNKDYVGYNVKDVEFSEYAEQFLKTQEHLK